QVRPEDARGHQGSDARDGDLHVHDVARREHGRVCDTAAQLVAATEAGGRRTHGPRLRTSQLPSSSSAGTSRRTRAGLPTTSMRGGTSFVTTAPAPTNASSPISTPGHRIAPPPTRAPRLIVGPLISSCRLSVRPMKLSLVVTTQGAMKTWSSSVEYAVMYTSAWILVMAPMVVSFSTSDPRPRTTSSP